MQRHPLRVLFVCVHNSARSIMAEALVRELGGTAFQPASAGIEATGVHPLTLRALAEIGIDASWATSKTIGSMLDQPWDLVITVCDPAVEACPVVPGARMAHWSFDDPSAAPGSDDERMETFRRVRDEIAEHVRGLVGDGVAVAHGDTMPPATPRSDGIDVLDAVTVR